MDAEEIFMQVFEYAILFWNSFFFSVIKFLLALYTVILFFDIIMILYLRGIKNDFLKGKYGAVMPIAHRKVIQKKWDSVERHMGSHHGDEWKIAILEADAIVSDVLGMVGFSGENFRERVDNANLHTLEQKEDLSRVHRIRNAIIRDPSLTFNKQEAMDVIRVYETFLKNWEAIE